MVHDSGDICHANRRLLVVLCSAKLLRHQLNVLRCRSGACSRDANSLSRNIYKCYMFQSSLITVRGVMDVFLETNDNLTGRPDRQPGNVARRDRRVCSCM